MDTEIHKRNVALVRMLLLGAWVNCYQCQENLSNFVVVLMLMLAASVTYYLVLFVVLLMNILYCMSSVINAPFHSCLHDYVIFLNYSLVRL